MVQQQPLTRAPEVDLVQVGGLWVHKSIPALYQQRVAEWPHEVTVHWREHGVWRGISQARGAQRVQHVALGLMSLGVTKGDRVGIVANTCPEWGQIDMGILHAGAVTVGIYPSLLAADVAYQVDHAGLAVLFVEDEAQLKKVESVREDMPTLEHLVVMKGEVAGSMTLEELERRGRELEDGPARFEATWRELGQGDLATIIYTSGTTGQPKGVMLTHGNLSYVVHASATVLPYRRGDTSVAFLPMAHALQRVASYGGLYTGARGYFTESPQTLMDDIKDVEPSVQVSVPRIWEKLYARLQEILARSPRTRQRVFAWGLEVGREAAACRRERRPMGLRLRLRNALAKRLVHDRLKERVFGKNIRFLTSGGAPIDTEILEFFEALDLLILEGWGLTETAAPATLNLPDAYKFGTVGRPIRGTEIKVAEDGELLVRGPGVFSGYYENEQATAEAFTEDGFFKTGDIGDVDADGFVRITDRKKNIIVLSNGKNIAPQKLENHFQTISLIGNALVHGDRRNYLTGLFTLDGEEAVLWGVAKGILSEVARTQTGKEGIANFMKVVQSPALQAHIKKAVGEHNARLPRFEQLKKWELLPEVWSPSDGSLTPTLKLKRRVIEERHKALLDSFYEG